MNVEYDAPITNGNITRKGVLINHDIGYEKQIVVNFDDAPPLTIPIDGLSDADIAIVDVYRDMLKRNIKGEHQSGEVTARFTGKVEMARLEAEKAEAVAVETINALEEK